MDKISRKHILIITIILSLAVAFVPIYYFVLAAPDDDNKFQVTTKKIISVEDGTVAFDSNDAAGNDSSNSNGRVRTFDSIRYTVKYTIAEKEATTGSIEGREVQVEVLIPASYESVLRYGEEAFYMDERSTPKTYGGTNYYYASFNVPIAEIGANNTFSFDLDDINTDDINTHNSIKPLIFIRETTDQATPSIINVSTLPADITCERDVTVTDPGTGTTTTSTSNVCDVTITGVPTYFVNMYSGSKKTDDQNVSKIPVGLLIGLRNDPVKGIKGSIIPKNLSIEITNSNINKLAFVENSEKPYESYDSTDDYKITMDALNTEMPEVPNGTAMPGNGSITSSINNDKLVVTVSNIKDYLVQPFYQNNSLAFYYFSTNYFLTEVAPRESYDYTDISVNLTSNTTDSNNNPTGITITDSYEYVLGNYSSNIDIYESSLTSGESEALEYGLANINYGGDFTIKTKFDYTGRSDSTGDGLTSLTNYVKIDNNVFKLHNNTSNEGYKFIPGEVTSTAKMELDTDGSYQKVYFGFGEWNANYFEATNAAGCPAIDFGNKEQLMNLYGGPCLVAKNTVQWAYAPDAEHDREENPISSNKGPLIVESSYVSNNTQVIELDASGTLELYGSVVNDYTVANTSHQIVTSATAYGKNGNDLRYLGNEYLDENADGTAIMANPSNFMLTEYSYNAKRAVSINNNVCNNPRCPVSGTTILISGIKVTKPVLKSHKVSDLIGTENNFYYYPFALTVDANASRSDDTIKYEKAYVDIYLPEYMFIQENYGADNDKHPSSIENTNLNSIYTKFNLGTPVENINYRIYHYELTDGSSDMSEVEKENLQKGILSKFTVYADIDSINTPNASKPEIFSVVDFEAKKYLLANDGTSLTQSYNSIAPDKDRMDELNNVILYNSSSVITKGTATPKYIEKNGSYTFNMLAYNHSKSVIEEGYLYPTADLYYILPYNDDLSSDTSSKIGNTKFKVNFTADSINAIQNRNDYKFYYATTGTQTNIIPDEIKTTSDPSSIWTLWEDPTQPISDVIAIKVVKQSNFEPETYFGSPAGLTVNVKASGSTDGNRFYNSFHILATKPDNFTCENDDPDDPNYCTEAKKVKVNYGSSSSVTSVYAREISGFVFEDFDYNGIYTDEESRLKDIPVSLYKVNQIPEGYDPIDPTTFVSDDDTLVGATTTSENGAYYFSGLPSGIYYVSFNINNEKYIVADLEKIDDTIPDSRNRNSSASLLPNTSRAISSLIEFPADSPSGRLLVSNINLGLAVKKEMAITLNKYITEVTITKNGRVETHDYSNQNLSKVSITVLNPKNTKVKVKYSFSIENTKYFPGYVGMIVDTIPEGMTFNPNLKENQYWTQYDNLLYFNGLSGKLFLPNEKQYFTLVLDLDLKEAGTYRNIVSARDLTLMGDELPVYDFSGLNNNNTGGGE